MQCSGRIKVVADEVLSVGYGIGPVGKAGADVRAGNKEIYGERLRLPASCVAAIVRRVAVVLACVRAAVKSRRTQRRRAAYRFGRRGAVAVGACGGVAYSRCDI